MYWNTACLRVDSGLGDEATTNYGKIAKAVGNIVNRGIGLSLIDINKSQYMFEPDEENDIIVYGMKALNGVGGEVIQEIITNRPYNSLEDFMDRTKVNKTVMISLIKSGAFDKFNERKKIMDEYIWKICEPKKRITLQNFNGLMEKHLIPEELNFQKRVFIFNKSLKANCKIDNYFIIKDYYYDFYEQFFDIDLLSTYNGNLAIEIDIWKKQYTKAMLAAKNYFIEHQEDFLNKLNNSLFNENWNRYADGGYSKWEMDSLGMYYHEHELTNVSFKLYNIVNFSDLSNSPIPEYTFKRNGIEIPIFKTNRIAGTVVAKDDAHSSVSILTINSGVVTVKFNRDYFAKYNRRISEVQPDGTKKYVETGWFQRGTLVVVNGIRRGDLFIAKKYKKTESHQLYKITQINDNGTIEMTNQRYGENGDDA